MTTITGKRPDQSLELRTHFRFSMWVSRTQMSCHLVFPRIFIRRKLDGNWSQDSSPGTPIWQADILHGLATAVANISHLKIFSWYILIIHIYGLPCDLLIRVCIVVPSNIYTFVIKMVSSRLPKRKYI